MIITEPHQRALHATNGVACSGEFKEEQRRRSSLMMKRGKSAPSPLVTGAPLEAKAVNSVSTPPSTPGTPVTPGTPATPDGSNPNSPGGNPISPRGNGDPSPGMSLRRKSTLNHVSRFLRRRSSISRGSGSDEDRGVGSSQSLNMSSDEFEATVSLEKSLVDLLNNAEYKRTLLRTWAMAIAPQGDELTPLATFTNIFFSKLFEQIPETKLMFHNQPLYQGRALSGTLSRMLKYLDDCSSDELKLELQTIAISHASYGVTPPMFGAFGQALVHAIATRLGDAFDDNVRKAWLATYTVVSTTIISYMDKDELEQLRISDWLAVAYSRNSAKVKMLWEKISDDPEQYKKFRQAVAENMMENHAPAKDSFKSVEHWAQSPLFIMLEHLPDLMDAGLDYKAQAKKYRTVIKNQPWLDSALVSSFCESSRVGMRECLGEKVYSEDSDIAWQRAMRLLLLVLRESGLANKSRVKPGSNSPGTRRVRLASSNGDNCSFM